MHPLQQDQIDRLVVVRTACVDEIDEAQRAVNDTICEAPAYPMKCRALVDLTGALSNLDRVLAAQPQLLEAVAIPDVEKIADDTRANLERAGYDSGVARDAAEAVRLAWRDAS